MKEMVDNRSFKQRGNKRNLKIGFGETIAFFFLVSCSAPPWNICPTVFQLLKRRKKYIVGFNFFPAKQPNF